MDVVTSRFGTLSVSPQDVLTFEQGLIGLRNCRRWVVLADCHSPEVGWLQCLDDEQAALAVVSPRRFVGDYQLRIERSDLAELKLAALQDAQVVAILGRTDGGWTLNLRAPLVINVERRLGRQVIAKDAPAVHHSVVVETARRLSA